MALGWPVSENGPMPGRPMRPVSKMAVDDRIDLVDAAARLVDALRIERDDPLGFGEPVEEQRRPRLRQAADFGGLRTVWPATCRSAASAPVVRSIHERAVDGIAAMQDARATR